MSKACQVNATKLHFVPQGAETILTPDALAFAAELVRLARPLRDTALNERKKAQAGYDQGKLPNFDPQTESLRRSDWKAPALPKALLDRRVEITGPVDRKMIINALNSSANVFMADFEDSSAPSFENMALGQKYLSEAVRGTLNFEDESSGKKYALNNKTALLMVRPRGFHLVEKHFEVDDIASPGGIFDFALFFFHNARYLAELGLGPFFYLPKMEHSREASIWTAVFKRAEELLKIPSGTIRATVLIETLPAAFQMHEILHALGPYAAGLNCGRWDYIFSYIKTLAAHKDHVLPDRAQVTMTQHCMRAYSHLLIRTCHQRGVHAMGGMAAQIPIKDDDEANRIALEKVRNDKIREAEDGHDGTWVAHPQLIPIAKEIFDARMTSPNQINLAGPQEPITQADLLKLPEGTRTEVGLRQNIHVGIRYLEAWFRGTGCVPIHNLMEDAATAEISRTQLWQWRKHQATLDDGRVISTELIRSVMEEELQVIQNQPGVRSETLKLASDLFFDLSTREQLESFLTLPAYERLTSTQR